MEFQLIQLMQNLLTESLTRFQWFVWTSNPITALDTVSRYQTTRGSRTYLFINLRPPPCETINPAWVNEGKEDNDHCKCQPRIQCGRQCHCIFLPPCGPPSADDIVEYKTYKGPDGKVEPGCRWYPAQTAKQDREVDHTPEALLAVSP